MRATAWLIAASMLAVATPAAAQDEEANLEFFYPLVTGRPVIERELELRVDHAKGRDGRETDVTGAIELPLLPRWQVELEIPLVFLDPRDGVATGGVGDLAVENKFLLFKSVEQRALVAAGFEARLPTGSERRGLGGEAAIEPFLRAGIALGPFDVMSEIAYEWNLNAHVHGEREQALTANAAVGYRLTRRFTPLVEVNTVTLVRGTEDEDAPKVRGKTQVYLTPGFNYRPLPGTTVRLGIELPVTEAKTFDYAIRAGVVWEF